MAAVGDQVDVAEGKGWGPAACKKESSKATLNHLSTRTAPSFVIAVGWAAPHKIASLIIHAGSDRKGNWQPKEDGPATAASSTCPGGTQLFSRHQHGSCGLLFLMNRQPRTTGSRAKATVLTHQQFGTRGQ
jgi:hypothetical protein